jgi:sortase (surface protein transpeptidase)
VRVTVSRGRAASPRRTGVVVVALLALLASACGQAELDPPDAEPEAVDPSPPVEEVVESAVEKEPPGPEGEPVRVVVPAIGVDAELVELGLEPDGAMEVPDFGLAGWYAEGPRPGHPGPAVIAAHVDSRAGPDVFYRLRDLAPGDDIHVHYDGGDTTSFVVKSSERTPKDELPADRIWPVTADRLLTLITCGGEFDRDVRHYRDNIIVYAAPVDP